MNAQVTQFEIMLYGNVRYQRAGWLIPLFLRVSPLGRDDVVECTGISEATAAKYLGDLAQLGIIVRQGYHDGYVLAAGGKQLVAQELLEAGAPTAVVVEPAESFKGAICTFDSVKESVINTDSVINSDLTEDSDQSSVTEQGAICTFEKIITHTDILFGDAVELNGLGKRDFNFTLGWIAQAYNQQGNGRLRSPAALVYAKLKRATDRPQKKYFEDPTKHLPDDYLVAIGLEPRHAQPAQEPEDEVEYVDTRAHVDETVTDQVRARFDAAMQAWEARVGKLKGAEAALYHSWAEGSFPVHFEDNQLQVGVLNGAVRDYLAQRATKIMTDLIGWDVEFVVAVETEDEDA